MMGEGTKIDMGEECERGCGRPGIRRRQNTAYPNDEMNFAILCAECQAENDEHWAEMWAEYYRGCL